MLNEFIANVSKKNGFSKSNRFDVFVSVPFALNSIIDGGGISRTLPLLCEATELPGRSLITAERKIYGPVTKMPYQTQYNEITLNFICTNTFDERAFFEAWIDFIMPVQGDADATRNIRFKETYATSIDIYQYDENINSIFTVTLIEAFPISMAAQPLNWSDDGFHRLSVQFAYSHYKTKSSTSSVVPPTRTATTSPPEGRLDATAPLI
jgi:hypothetical protein